MLHYVYPRLLLIHLRLLIVPWCYFFSYRFFLTGGFSRFTMDFPGYSWPGLPLRELSGGGPGIEWCNWQFLESVCWWFASARRHGILGSTASGINTDNISPPQYSTAPIQYSIQPFQYNPWSIYGAHNTQSIFQSIQSMCIIKRLSYFIMLITYRLAMWLCAKLLAALQPMFDL